MFRISLIAILSISFISNTTSGIDILDLGVTSGSSSDAFDVTPDGNVVVGANSDTPTAFRWSNNVMQSIPTLEQGFLQYGSARGVSNDGNIIVGYSGSLSNGRAFRWTSNSGSVGLGNLSGGTVSVARGVSGDGNIVVGYDGLGSFGSTTRAFVWTSQTNMVQLAPLTDGTYSRADAITEDGKYIVGTSNTYDGYHAVLWSINGTVRDLGIMAGAIGNYAVAVSADGRTIIGSSQIANGSYRPFMWEESTGYRDLGELNIGKNTNAYGLSLDGKLVVGVSGSLSSGTAFIYSSNVMYNLYDILVSQKVKGIQNWTGLTVAGAVSGDPINGYNIVGSGIISGNRHAFLVKGITSIPEPSSLLFVIISVLMFFLRIATKSIGLN